MQLSSLGYAQSTSSSGTGILRDTTVILEAGDQALVTQTFDRSKEIIFGTTSAKIAALRPGAILYAEKSSVFPLGLVAKVVSVTWTSSGGLEVETQPVELREAFVEFHIFLDNRRIYISPHPSNSASGSPVAPYMDDLSRPSASPDGSASGGLRQAETIPPRREAGLVPEYLGLHAADSAYPAGWSYSWPFDADLYKQTAGDITASLHVSGSLNVSMTAELLWNCSFLCLGGDLNFLLTPQETGTLTITASGNIASNPDPIKLVEDSIATFETPIGIPISADLGLYAGYSASAGVTASLTATESARLTAGGDFNIDNLTGVGALHRVRCEVSDIPNPVYRIS